MTTFTTNTLRDRINAEREAVREMEKYEDCDLTRIVKVNAAGAIRAYADAINLIETMHAAEKREQEQLTMQEVDA